MFSSNGSLLTLLDLAFVPYFLIKCICLGDMNMFARFDEIPTMTDGRAHRMTDR